MDVSTLAVFPDSDEKLKIARPRVLIRRSKFRIPKPVLEFHHQKSQSHNQYLENFVADNSLALNLSYLKEHMKPSPIKNSNNSQSLFYAFEGNKLSLSSLLDCKSTAEDLSSPLIRHKNSIISNDSRTKSKNFRRLKWTPGKIRASTCWAFRDFIQAKDNTPLKRRNQKSKNMKRELIPQTRASASAKSRQTIPELRISGMMKEIKIRDLHINVKDSANLTDFEYPTLIDANIIN